MMYIHLIFIFIVQNCRNTDQDLLSYENLECVDNDNQPVDWWYIYKPPANTGPYFETGANFTFITSRTSGRWEASERIINYNSMLQLTLSPLSENINEKNMAVLSYGDQNVDITEIDLQKSTAYGIIFGNEKGGVWISHTVPDFPAFIRNTPMFPSDEIYDGHMITCFSVQLADMDVIGGAVKNTQPNIIKFNLPEDLAPYLQHWQFITSDANKIGKDHTKKIKLANFLTQTKSLWGVILAREPGDSRCLFKRFARLRRCVLDVYSSELYHVPVVCEKEYSIRHIDTISLKFPEQIVYYINNKTDRMSFGVSTAASWQRRNLGTAQHWTCTGNTDTAESLAVKGCLIICVNNYEIWSTFDNLKTKEPSC